MAQSKILSVLLFNIFFLSSISLSAQSTRILLEGNFSDWLNTPILNNDPSGDDGSSNIDFGFIQVANDEDFLFIRIEVGKELNLQSDNEITLFIDADNNTGTGTNIHGIGADLTFNFGDRNGTVRVGNSTETVFHDEIGLVTAPTVSGDEFEFSIARDLTFFGQSIFTSNTIKIVIDDNSFNGDRIPDASGGVTYNFNNLNLEELPSYSIQKTASHYLRALSWNVLQDSPWEGNSQSSFLRIIEALEPELIGFQEIYDHSSGQTANLVESVLPSGAGEDWYHAKIFPDIITVSRHPILEAESIDGNGNGAFLIDLQAPYNTELLFIVAHTPCCENDFGRQLEIDAIMGFIRDAKAGIGPIPIEENTPIVICGDMNMVGDQQQLETFITGDIINQSSAGPDFAPDWDGSDFEDAIPYTTNLPMSFTWFNDFSSFFPGRLDFMIYSGSVMEQVNAFSLFTASLPSDSLNAYNLFSFDAEAASDHLPVVVDFDLNVETAVHSDFENLSSGLKIEKIYPNPVPLSLNVEYSLLAKGIAKLVIRDMLGREIQILFEKQTSKGIYLETFNLANLPKGIYQIELSLNAESVSSETFVKE